MSSEFTDVPALEEGISFWQRYKIVCIIVSVFVALMILYYIYAWYVSSKNANKTVKFPPWVSPCPDYWTATKGNQCTRTKPNGPASCTTLRNLPPSMKYPNAQGSPTVDFTNVSDVDKCHWANQCNVYWEGISDKPCVASSFP